MTSRGKDSIIHTKTEPGSFSPLRFKMSALNLIKPMRPSLKKSSLWIRCQYRLRGIKILWSLLPKTLLNISLYSDCSPQEGKRTPSVRTYTLDFDSTKLVGSGVKGMKSVLLRGERML